MGSQSLLTDNLASVLIIAQGIPNSSASHIHRRALLMKESLFSGKVAII